MEVIVKSPPVNREVGDLAPVFRVPFLAWLSAAEATLPHVEIRVTETRRTRQRQEWLFAQGREEPFLGAPLNKANAPNLHLGWGQVRTLVSASESCA